MPTLEFKGKQHIYAHHLTVPFSPLVVDPQKSHPSRASASDSDLVPDDNLIIHGDNLLALKALLPRYAGKVDCIYIDPPYNTGNEDWTYNDNVNSPMMQEWLAQNAPVDGEDLERHDKWLCMMWPRLQLLSQLLAEDGVIFVSIDDNEQHHLRLLMDDIFGRSHLLGELVWKSRQNKDNRNKTGVSIDHEYILSYGKSVRGDERDTSQYSNPDDDPRGDWTSGNMVGLATREARPNLHYDLVNPATDISYGCPPMGWRFDQARMSELIADGRILWPGDQNGRPRVKTYLSELKNRYTGFSSVVGNSVYTRTGTREVEEILGSRELAFPKPHELVRELVLQGCPSDGIVLDSFAGTGTTAHAALALNREDGGNRRFILVECEDYADTVTAERVRRVIDGVPNAKRDNLSEGLGGSFTYCTLGDPFDAESLLNGEGLPDYETLAVFLIHTAAGLSLEADALRTSRNDQRFYQTAGTDYYLYYEPDVEWLKSDEAMLTPERAKQIEERERPATVFGSGKYLTQRELTEMGITFCQLPYELFKGG